MLLSEPTEANAGPIVVVLLWLFWHGAQLAPVVLGLCVVVVLACSLLLWFKEGARYLWAWRQWRSVSLFRPSGGAGGHTRTHAHSQSLEYRRTMQSAGWRRRRAQAIRRAGHRCQECGARGSLDVHHTTYVHLGAERDNELLALCVRCHGREHGRAHLDGSAYAN